MESNYCKHDIRRHQPFQYRAKLMLSPDGKPSWIEGFYVETVDKYTKEIVHLFISQETTYILSEKELKTVTAYTMAEDSNGQRIYEGDIIIGDLSPIGAMVGFVFYDPMTYMFRILAYRQHNNTHIVLNFPLSIIAIPNRNGVLVVYGNVFDDQNVFMAKPMREVIKHIFGIMPEQHVDKEIIDYIEQNWGKDMATEVLNSINSDDNKTYWIIANCEEELIEKYNRLLQLI